MSRPTTRRVLTTAGLALGTATLTLTLAPTALAAPSVTVSSSTLAPGAAYTVSGTGCLPLEGYDVQAVFLPAVDPQSADTATPAADGSWTLALTAPAEPGSYEFAVYCDRYNENFDYADVTITVTPASEPVPPAAPPATTPTPPAPTGAIRGPAAITAGVASPDTGAATGDSAPLGRTVVKILTGFKPGEVVTVTLHSTPQRVGTFTADASGTVRIEFTVPAGTPVGSHTLVYEGSQGTYYQEAFAVAPASSGGSEASLAYTGASVALPLGLGVGALALGGGLVFASRRRSAEATQA